MPLHTPHNQEIQMVNSFYIYITSSYSFSAGSPLGSVVVECIERIILDWKVSGYPVLVFATAAQSDDIPRQILSAFKHQVQLQV